MSKLKTVTYFLSENLDNCAKRCNIVVRNHIKTKDLKAVLFPIGLFFLPKILFSLYKGNSGFTHFPRGSPSIHTP